MTVCAGGYCAAAAAWWELLSTALCGECFAGAVYEYSSFLDLLNVARDGAETSKDDDAARHGRIHIKGAEMVREQLSPQQDA